MYRSVKLVTGTQEKYFYDDEEIKISWKYKNMILKKRY